MSANPPKGRQPTPKDDALTPMQARFVACLSTMSMAAAAKTTGISERTATRWVKLAPVAGALRSQADATLSEAARLARAELAANIQVMTELRDSKDTPPSVRLAAAARLNDDALKMTTETTVSERLAEIEQELHEQRKRIASVGAGRNIAIVS